jgi:hypothetical protein
MWRGAALLLAGVLLGPGCRSLGPDEGVLSTVSLGQSRLIRGNAVEITVRVFDRGTTTLRGSSSCLIGYSVLDAGGTVVAPGGVVCTADLVTVRIPDGGLVGQFTWHGYTGLGTTGDPLAPGIYRVVGGPGAPGDTQESVSEPASLELVAP